MPTLRDRLNSGIYRKAIETHQEARNRRSSQIKELRSRHSNLVFTAQLTGSSRELRQAAEALYQAEKAGPAVRTRMNVLGFLTPIPGGPIPISRY